MPASPAAWSQRRRIVAEYSALPSAVSSWRPGMDGRHRRPLVAHAGAGKSPQCSTTARYSASVAASTLPACAARWNAAARLLGGRSHSRRSFILFSFRRSVGVVGAPAARRPPAPPLQAVKGSPLRARSRMTSSTAGLETAAQSVEPEGSAGHVGDERRDPERPNPRRRAHDRSVRRGRGWNHEQPDEVAGDAAGLPLTSSASRRSGALDNSRAAAAVRSNPRASLRSAEPSETCSLRQPWKGLINRGNRAAPAVRPNRLPLRQMGFARLRASPQPTCHAEARGFESLIRSKAPLDGLLFCIERGHRHG
jgi:hypothetical protein